MSNQEETDNRVVLYSIYAADNGKYVSAVQTVIYSSFRCTLQVPSEAHFFLTQELETIRILDITKIADECTERRCTALLALYTFTRCDTTSAFKGIGKVKPIKILEKNSKFEDVFAK